MRVLVTGASGFVGRALCSALLAQGHAVRIAVRCANSMPAADGLDLDVVVVGDVDAQTDWSAALAGIDCVIHCAARAHVMHETETDALAAYRVVNVAGTQRLAKQAAALDVRRLVFLSSIKVNGESTDGLPRPFRARTDEGGGGAPAPEDPYGVSKWEAEQALWAVAANTDLEVVVVRPPLVYGPGAKGNLARLLKLVCLGVPLPLGAVHNQRSLIGLDNLVDLLILCVDHPVAAGQTLLVSDGEDVSTPDLLRHMGAGLGRSPRLLPVPVALLRLVGCALGKETEIDRLVGSLQIDSRHTRELLDWTPPVSVAEGIRRMVQGS
jgi:nucleoside-diphosphate-sugar epimerase